MKNCITILLVVLLFSCQKESKSTNPTTPSSNQTDNPFGVIINKSDGVNLTLQGEIATAKALSAKFVRHPVILSQWTGSDAYYDLIVTNELKPVINLNWSVPALVPVPFLTSAELSNYTNIIAQVLTKYRPELVVIENEELNETYHSGNIQQYIDMLNAAIPAVHAKGLKVTNGGITSIVEFLVWQDYANNGQTTKANDYALRTFPPGIYNMLPNLPAAILERMQRTDSLLNAYKTMNLDYVNFHWYADSRQRNTGPYNPAVDTSHVNTQSLTELVDYIKKRTGKPVITNEIGEKYYSAGYVTDILQATLDMKLPYVIWYSGDGDQAFDAKGLQNGNGSLRLAGFAYRDFMNGHFH